MTTHAVLQSIHHAPGLHELVLARQALAFTVGDCVAVYDGQGESRPYSLASSPEDDALRLIYRPLTGGLLTSYMDELAVGDEVEISAPFGWFRPVGGQTVFIATGTGIAPFLAHLRSHPSRPPVRILWGVRHLADAPFAAWIAEQAALTLAITRDAETEYYHGRVTDLLPTLPLAETTYYLCGLDAMIDEVSGWLEEHGVAPSHIHREVFFHASPHRA